MNELLDYNKNTGIFTWKTNRIGRVKSGKVAGSITTGGYVYIQVLGKRYLAHRLAWLYVYGYLPENYIDHIDKDKTNNRIDNLREVTSSQNLQNTGIPRTNTSGFKGVSMDKNTKKWKSQIRANGKKIFLGLFKTPEDASSAYIAAQEKYHTHRPLLTGAKQS